MSWRLDQLTLGVKVCSQHVNWTQPNWPATSRPSYTKRSLVARVSITTSLAAAKLERLLLAQFMCCERGFTTLSFGHRASRCWVPAGCFLQHCKTVSCVYCELTSVEHCGALAARRCNADHVLLLLLLLMLRWRANDVLMTAKASPRRQARRRRRRLTTGVVVDAMSSTSGAALAHLK